MAKASEDMPSGLTKNKMIRNNTGPRNIPIRDVGLGFIVAIESYNYQKNQGIQTAIIRLVDYV